VAWLFPRPPPPPRGRQLVLLDHGLYRELSPEFRLTYCRLWRALVLADVEGIKYHGAQIVSEEVRV
jgi:aarF domain-containing kinase